MDSFQILFTMRSIRFTTLMLFIIVVVVVAANVPEIACNFLHASVWPAIDLQHSQLPIQT